MTTASPPTGDPAGRGNRRLLVMRGTAAIAASTLVGAALWILVINRPTIRSAEEYCARIRNSQTLSDALAAGNSQDIRAAIRRFQGTAAIAPVEIEAPTKVLVDYANALAATLDTAGGTDAETKSALADAVRRLSARSPEVVSAGRAVEAYVRTKCGFDPTATTGAAVTPPSR